MVIKHSYMDDEGQNPDPKPDAPGTNSRDQKNIPRTDPGLKKGYNEKNPSQPQGGFTSESQADEPAENDQGDESKGPASKRKKDSKTRR